MSEQQKRLRVAVIGGGIAGLSAAWLLGRAHDVVLYEKSDRLGGHSHTVTVAGNGPVDIGFIVYNEAAYPNLVALFAHLGVKTAASDMSFAVASGRLVYGSRGIRGLLAAPGNILRPGFWAMIADLLRFYREAPADLAELQGSMESLGEYLARRRYGRDFIEHHLLPMTAAIWSTPVREALLYPAASFIRFCDNHGLLKLTGRPVWRTVCGGSQEYVRAIEAVMEADVRLMCPQWQVRRIGGRVVLQDSRGEQEIFDHVVMATHADQSLAMLGDADAAEISALRDLRYQKNVAVLHRDARLMPPRRAAWGAWNYLGDGEQGLPYVSYWMNRLQKLAGSEDLFLTLNPAFEPRDCLHVEEYAHPLFDAPAMRAQNALWRMQGRRNSWFCGAYCGAGFHEDGVQSGLAVAEALAGVRRPWQVRDENGRMPFALSPIADARMRAA